MVIFIVLWPYLLTAKLRCLQKNNIGHTIEGDSLEMDLFETETPVEEDIDFDEPNTTEKNENGEIDHDHGLRTHNALCLVTLQVPKCFGSIQIV